MRSSIGPLPNLEGDSACVCLSVFVVFDGPTGTTHNHSIACVMSCVAVMSWRVVYRFETIRVFEVCVYLLVALVRDALFVCALRLGA